MSDLTPQKIAALNEFGEAGAWANYFHCAPPEFIKKYKVETKRIGSVLVAMIPELNRTYYNRIFGLGVDAPATESTLDDAIGILQNAGCEKYMVQICPLAQPSQLPAWLSSRGFVLKSNHAKCYRGNNPAQVVQTDLRVESIGKEHAEVFADIAITAFKMLPKLRPLVNGNIGQPGWHHYLAFEGEQPVAAAAMFISGDVAWLGFDSTLKSHRRRGGHSAMVARRIRDGLAFGCKWFVTETHEDTPASPNPSYHNMLRAGFELAYLRPNYVYQHSSS